MAVIAAAGVRYEEWMTFALGMWTVLMALGAAAILAAMTIGI